MTPSYTLQARELREKMDEFKKVGVKVLGISTDKPGKLLHSTERAAPLHTTV